MDDSISSNIPHNNPDKLSYAEMIRIAEERAEATNRTIFINQDGIPRLRKLPVSNKDALKGKRYCPDCEEVRDTHLFTSKNGRLYTYCKECRNKQRRESHTLEKGRARFLFKNYGITKEEYDLMLFQQGSLCAVCGQAETLIHWRTKEVQPLSVDHNHETGQVRELVCNTCNKIIGFIEQDRSKVQKALKYLKKHDT